MESDIQLDQQRERKIEDLITALQEGDSATQWTAAEALGELGDPRAVDPLIVALKHLDRRNTGVAAAEALGMLGDLRAVEPLLTAVKQEQGEMYEPIVKALEKLGVSPKLVPPPVSGTSSTGKASWWRFPCLLAAGVLAVRAVGFLLSPAPGGFEDVRFGGFILFGIGAALFFGSRNAGETIS